MAELNLVEKVIVLEGVDLMSSLSPDQMASIAMIATEVQYPPGRAIFEEKKCVEAVYVVVSGSVELSRGGEPLDTAGPGAMLGGWALLDEDCRSTVGAKTLEDTHLLRVGREEFRDLMADNVDIAVQLLSALAKQFGKLVEQ